MGYDEVEVSDAVQTEDVLHGTMVLLDPEAVYEGEDVEPVLG